jgi:hypothetical protein
MKDIALEIDTTTNEFKRGYSDAYTSFLKNMEMLKEPLDER